MNRTTQAATHLSRSWARAAAVALTALLCLGAAMQARAQGRGHVDPPDRVARLSDVNGQVWLFSPDANEWLAVERNRPLTTGDRVATDNGAHAEITLGSTTLRLDSATELEIVLLDDRRYNVRLHSGSVAARLRNSPSVAEFALDTDEGRFRAQTVGRYRFDRFEQASDLTVENGQAVFEGRNSALPLTTGQHAQFWLDAGGAPQYNMVEPARDSFAAWNEERDRAVARPSAAVRYVSPEMTGAEDLDRYGQWEQSSEYGPIWTPRAVAVDWAPYSAGHWAFVRPWGWTWVDDAPWGFAPFHYGRWVNHRSRWGWVPGTYVARPVYAPALVAWIGGPRVSVSISIGGGGGGPPVGWFPLAPREVYVPSYGYSPTYVRNINITQVTNVTQITTIVNNTNGAADRRDFANRKFPHAVTVVPASVLTSRQAVAPEAARFRSDPQVRALVADARPASAMNVAPVAAPAIVARPPADRVAIRPPFEGRAPGVFPGRPGPGSPGAAPQAVGASPQATLPPGPGVGQGRPTAPALAGRPPQPVPGPGGARPDSGRPDAARPEAGRPGAVATPDSQAIERPPVRGGVMRERDGDTPGANRGINPNAGLRPPQPNAAPAPNPPAAPAVQAVTPPPAPQVIPAAPADERTRDRRRGGPEDARPPGRPDAVPTPPVGGAPQVAPPGGRSFENRGGDPGRPGTPRGEPRAIEPRAIEPRVIEPRATEPRAIQPRAIEPRAIEPRAIEPRAIEPRAAEAPRPPVVRPAEAQRAPEAPRNVAPPPRVAEPPKAVPPAAAKPPEAARPEPVRAAPEQRNGRPEAPRREDKRDEKRDDKREPGEKQR